VPKGYKAFSNIGLVGDFDLEKLTTRVGKHGKEIVIASEFEAVPTDTLCAIVEDGMLSTWYPGDFTAKADHPLPPKKDWKPNWTVKFI
jgi:hypothetical protein